MESAARDRVRASSAMFNLTVAFQWAIGKSFLIEPCGRVVFSIPRLVFLAC